MNEMPRSYRVTEADIAALVQQTSDANLALLNGEIARYFEMMPLADDYTLMTPFGGPPRIGFDARPEDVAELERFFQSGDGHIELVESYASGDLVVLAFIERQRAAVGGLPEQDWSLRVTQVYRREGGRWTLAHRHADGLVPGISVEEAARIARGAGG